MRRAVRGLTLLELLIATGIFALVGVMAYTALFSLLEARDTGERQADRLAALQYAVSRLSQDLRQAVDRPVRALVPTEGAALFTPTDGKRVLVLTRGGRPNPAGLIRSTLARVHWAVDGDDRLLRAVQARTDQLPGTEPRRRVLLDNVESVELRFLDPDSRWQNRWPPQQSATPVEGLPRAVEVTLVLSDWGEIVRLIPLAGAAPPVDEGS